MSDFYSIDLSEGVEKFNWIEVLPEKDNLPGPRFKHHLLSTKDKIYLVGGLHSNIKASNQIFCFDPETNKWEELKTVGDTLPPMESFGCVLCEK